MNRRQVGVYFPESQVPDIGTISYLPDDDELLGNFVATMGESNCSSSESESCISSDDECIYKDIMSPTEVVNRLKEKDPLMFLETVSSPKPVRVFMTKPASRRRVTKIVPKRTKKGTPGSL